MEMIYANPVAFGTKLVRLAMLAFGVASVVLAKIDVTFSPAEADVQEVVGYLISGIMLVWSFKNDADLQQEKPIH